MIIAIPEPRRLVGRSPTVISSAALPIRGQARLRHFSGRSRRRGVVFLEPGDIRDGGEGVRLKKPERRR